MVRMTPPMSSETIPEWAMEAANACLPGNAWNPLTAERIANALLAAEQRGREKAADECDRFADQFPTYPEFDEPHNVGRHLAAAIRSLGEKT